MPQAFAFAFASAGNNIAAKIAMIAITTKSSIKVKAIPILRLLLWSLFRILLNDDIVQMTVVLKASVLFKVFSDHGDIPLA